LRKREGDWLEKLIKLNNMKTGSLTNLILLLMAVSLFGASGCGNSGIRSDEKNSVTTLDTGTAVIQFTNLEYDFGVVTEGEKLACVFNFSNTGTAPLVITSASTSCGCTVPEFSKKPIGPGQKGTLEVVFDSSGREGIQTKTITVQSNASMPVMILAIRADVKTKVK